MHLLRASSACLPDLQTAVKLVVPGELGRHAVTEGKKAVARFSGLQ